MGTAVFQSISDGDDYVEGCMAFRFGIVWNPCHSKEILLLNQEILSILSNNDVRQGPKTARQFIAADKGIMWKRICSEKEYHVMTEDIDFNDAVVEEFIQNLQLMYRELKSWLTGFVCKENVKSSNNISEDMK